jgi:hypothetical protein
VEALSNDFSTAALSRYINQIGTRLARTALAAHAAPWSAPGAFFRSSPPIRHAKKHSRKVTACGSQYKGVPDRILKSQTPPHLLLALLTEPLIADHLGDSPRRAAA